MQRYRFWRTNNVWSGRCPSGMAEDDDGDYVKYAAVRRHLETSAVYGSLEKRAEAIGTTLEVLLKAAEVDFKDEKGLKPRVLRLPKMLQESLRFTNGRSQRLWILMAGGNSIGNADVNKSIPVTWSFGNGMIVQTTVSHIKPFPEKRAELWLEFNEQFKLISSGCWKTENIRLEWF